MPPGSPPTPIARPTIKIAGAQLRNIDDVIHVQLNLSIGAAAHAHLRVDRADTATTTFGVGKELTITAPDPRRGGVETIFSGTIVSVGLDWRADRHELIVDAYDKSFRLSQRTDVKSYANLTIGDLIGQIASAHSMSARVSSKISSLRYEYQQQWASPHHLIADICHRTGCEWWVEGSEIIVRRRSEAAASICTLTPDSGLRRFSARFSSIDQVSTVDVRGWDPTNKADVTARKPGVNTAAPSTPSIVTATLESARPATSWPRQVVSGDDVSIVAEGIAARMGSAVLSARGECDVEPAVRPGAVVTIANVSSSWNGDYYVSEVEHEFGRDQPFVTRFVTGTSDDQSLVGLLGGADRRDGAMFTNGLTVGVVTNNHDETAKLGRVKVRLPYMTEDGESAWARVVAPGAGKDRGLLMLPEIDDEVLVGFENGDVQRPYVLGGLWNGRDAPPLISTNKLLLKQGKIVTKVWRSRKGHEVRILDGAEDADDMVVLTLKNEKAMLILADDSVSLLHDGDFPLTIATKQASIELLKGGDISVKAKNITLDAEQAITLKASDLKVDAKSSAEIKANVKVDVKGNGGVAVSGGTAMVEISGSMVKVN